MSVQGIQELGLGGSYDAAEFNKARNNIMLAFGMPRGLRVTNMGQANPDEQAGIKGDLIKLSDGGSIAMARNVDVAVDITGTGTNGLDTGTRAAGEWYWLWIIAKCTAADGIATDVAGVASLSPTGPVMPSGYTHKALVSVFPTDASANIVPFVQNRFRWRYLSKQLLASDSGNTGWVSQDITARVPTAVVEQALVWFWVDSRYASYEGNGYLRTYGETLEFARVDTDKAEESHIVAWMAVPDGYVDYRLFYTAGYIYGDLHIQGFIFPIWREP